MYNQEEVKSKRQNDNNYLNEMVKQVNDDGLHLIIFFNLELLLQCAS